MKNKKYLLWVLMTMSLYAIARDRNSENTSHATQVAQFTGQQVTGVAVSNQGRIFVNFPRWRTGVNNSVVEVHGKDGNKPYPNKEWNSWEIEKPLNNNKFVAVQSVQIFDHFLYVLDTRCPKFQKVLDAPRVFVFDLITNSLVHIYVLSNGSYHDDSYINDLQIDKKYGKIYFTDSGHPGLVVLDTKIGSSKRVLDAHSSTTAEVSFLTFKGVQRKTRVNSDGIAYDAKNERLYFHALSGYSLYSIDVKTLINSNEAEIEKAVKLEGKTPAPDGMILDQNGNLYMADLENNKIVYRTSNGRIVTLLEGEQVRWADSFSIYAGYLFYTNSRINEVQGDISGMVFTLNKIKLAK